MKSFIKYGILGALLGFAWTLVGYILGNETQEKLKWLSMLIMIVIVVFCFRAVINEEKKANEGFISFGRAFGMAFKTGLVMAVCSAVFTYLYFNLINPEYMDFAIQKAQEQMQTQGLSDEQIDMSMKMQAKFMTPAVMTIFAFVSSVIIYVIVALIMGAILKKENPNQMN
ncbi:MAG TPA: DUF4199 domain-containing protein [Bacteroidia bacterium]|nr:DUF4199 domain-containing protein [Bacteroidia bacterium]